MKLKKEFWFTLVELIISITILAILAAIAFMYWSMYVKDTRDAVRTTDMWSVSKALDLYAVKNNWFYPEPDEWIQIIYSWTIEVYTQWKFWETAFKTVEIMNKEVLDPEFKNNYVYSVTSDRREFQIWAIEENWDLLNSLLINISYAWDIRIPALVKWNYNWLMVSSNSWSTTYVFALPSIINTDVNDVDISSIIRNHKMVINWYGNLPWSYYNSKYDVSWWWDLNVLNFDKFVVFKWETKDLKNIENTRLKLLNMLKEAYKWTKLENEWKIKEIIQKNIDLNIPSNKIKNYSIDIINDNLKIWIPENQKVEEETCNILWFEIWDWESMDLYTESNIDWDAWYDCNSKKQTRICNKWLLSWDAIYNKLTCVKWTWLSCSATSQSWYTLVEFWNWETQNIIKEIWISSWKEVYTANALCINGTIAINWESRNLVCDASYHSEFDDTQWKTICFSNIKSCDIDNGTWNQVWDWTNWWDCRVVSCDWNYSITSNTCELTNLARIETSSTVTASLNWYRYCSSWWRSWTSCYRTNYYCPSWYSRSGNSCYKTVSSCTGSFPYASNKYPGYCYNTVNTYRKANPSDSCTGWYRDSCSYSNWNRTCCSKYVLKIRTTYTASLRSSNSYIGSASYYSYCPSWYSRSWNSCYKTVTSYSCADWYWMSWTTCVLWNTTPAIVCEADEHREWDVCVNNTKTVNIENWVWTQTWDWDSWWIVNVTSCDAWYHEEWSFCLTNTKSCYVTNWVWEQIWDWSSYWNCEIASCNNWYYLYSKDWYKICAVNWTVDICNSANVWKWLIPDWTKICRYTNFYYINPASWATTSWSHKYCPSNIGFDRNSSGEYYYKCNSSKFLEITSDWKTIVEWPSNKVTTTSSSPEQSQPASSYYLFIPSWMVVK